MPKIKKMDLKNSGENPIFWNMPKILSNGFSNFW
jgi:hypothetical protein